MFELIAGHFHINYLKTFQQSEAYRAMMDAYPLQSLADARAHAYKPHHSRRPLGAKQPEFLGIREAERKEIIDGQ